LDSDVPSLLRLAQTFLRLPCHLLNVLYGSVSKQASNFIFKLKEKFMGLKSAALSLLFVFAASASSLATAQGTGTGNASTSSGAANADTMAPGATGTAVPKGAGDTSASGAPSAGNTKSMQKKPAKTKRRDAASAQGGDTSQKPSQ
jgi:hypothetical protein